MSQRLTPETNGIQEFDYPGGVDEAFKAMCLHARRLERQRDELLEALEKARAAITGTDIEHLWVNWPKTNPSTGLGKYIDAAIANAKHRRNE
jgi:hypothetical protein